ncbi:putative late blight resistance protein R1A-4 [Salvia divinorum]|uniref:Late blight resistance protein R1A-4 n=1 Tax=Salvia divinorum TaxID=28513 RepID=A0ABD1G8Z8_SALDI
MAAYGAASSLKNTIQRILQSSRITLAPPPPSSRMLRFARFYCSVFDNSYFKWGMLAYGVTVYLKKKIGLAYYVVFDESYFKWAMAAYVAAVSLKIMMIKRVPHSSAQILQTTYDAMCDLQKTLLKLDDTSYSIVRAKVNELDERIKQTIWEFEDLLESHIIHQIHLSFSVDLQTLQPSVDDFVKRVMVMEVEYYIELMDMPEEEREPVSSRIDVGGINSNMVGLSDEFESVRDFLLGENEGNSVAIVGMAGAGKTTLAKKVFDDPLVQRHFELRAWVKVGRQCELNETLLCILAQVDPSTRDQMLTHDEDEKLVGFLEERLKDKKCLVVLDDVWGWYTEVMEKLPEQNV